MMAENMPRSDQDDQYQVMILQSYPSTCHSAIESGPQTTGLSADGLLLHLTRLLKGLSPCARCELRCGTKSPVCLASAASSRGFVLLRAPSRSRGEQYEGTPPILLGPGSSYSEPW